MSPKCEHCGADKLQLVTVAKSVKVKEKTYTWCRSCQRRQPS